MPSLPRLGRSNGPSGSRGTMPSERPARGSTATKPSAAAASDAESAAGQQMRAEASDHRSDRARQRGTLRRDRRTTPEYSDDGQLAQHRRPSGADHIGANSIWLTASWPAKAGHPVLDGQAVTGETVPSLLLRLLDHPLSRVMTPKITYQILHLSARWLDRVSGDDFAAHVNRLDAAVHILVQMEITARLRPGRSYRI